ncbi:MAG TPA: hypothetical protein VMG35_25960 [Bryobacteraceae bacterium]|nr:hypothetical protein [Bryobacteraceae bacterium]
MRLKSFFAESVEAALAEGSRELGADALLIESRKAPPESRHLGAYEVVLADNRSVRPAGGPAAEPVARELAALRRQLDGMRRSLSQTALAAPRWLAPSSQAAEIFNLLVAAELEPGLAREVAEGVAARLGAARVDAERAARAAAAEIESRFSVDARLGREDAAARMVALVGPPGSGKTTTLVKLAAVYGLAARRPALLVSADNRRIAAADQLRCFAAILGVGCETVETSTALAQTLEMHRGKGLILIDTPGFGAAEMSEAGDLAAYLSAHREIDTHLVLSASMKSADITRAVDRFEIFRPAKLLFTRLDETGALGPLVGEAARTQKPISFLAAGQNIPEDLEPAQKARVVKLVLPALTKEALEAA